jgi:hypothetical protein
MAQASILRRARRAGMTISERSYWTLITDPDTGECAGIGNRRHKCRHAERRLCSLVQKREMKRAGRLGAP